MIATAKTAVLIEPNKSMAYVMTTILKRHQFNVIAAQNIQEALQKMKGRRAKITIVAEELRAGKHDGIDFCRALNQTFKGRIPIVVTSHHATQEMVVRAIRSGSLGFIVKPIKEGDFIKKIELAMHRVNEDYIVSDNLKELNFKEGMSLSEMIDLVIHEADEIRAMPQAVAKIAQVSNDDKSSASTLEKAILVDASISAMIIKRANSAYYKGESIVDNVKDAIVRIGFDECRKLVMSASVYKLFTKQEKCFGFNREAFWLHSVATGVLAEMICARIGTFDVDRAFMAGLLHDFGKVVYDDYLSFHFQKALQLSNINNLSLFEAEQKVFDRTHNAVSRSVMVKWNFPEDLIEASFKHHVSPVIDDDKYYTMVDVMYLANLMAKASLVGSGGDCLCPRVSETVWNAFKFKSMTFDQEFVEAYFDEVGRYVEFLGIKTSDAKYNQLKLDQTIALYRDVGNDDYMTAFFLQCRGYHVEVFRQGSTQVPDIKNISKIVILYSDRETTNDLIQAIIKKYPEIEIYCFTGSHKYSNPTFSDLKLKVIEGPLDYSLLKSEF